MKLDRMTEVMEEKMKWSTITKVEASLGSCKIFYKNNDQEDFIEFFYHEFEGRTQSPFGTLAVRFSS